MDFAEHFRKSDVSENNLLWSISMKLASSKVLVTKIDERYNILNSASHYLLVKR